MRSVCQLNQGCVSSHKEIHKEKTEDSVHRMDQRKRNTYRRHLINRRENLAGLVRMAETYRREPDLEATHDPSDHAANACTKELIVLMSANDRQLLKSTEAALELIEEGKYGDCLKCGEPIHEKRLDAIPWAVHCVRCQDLTERSLSI